MKKDFVSVFNKDISIDEYRLDSMLGKNIKVKENEFPTILIDKEDDTNKYININNNSNLDLNENSITKDNIADMIEANETDKTEDMINEDNLSDNLEDNIGLTENDLTNIEYAEDFNLENAIFGDKYNDIYKNNSEKLDMNTNDIEDMKEIDLMEEDNLKKEDEILNYENKEVVVPSIDNVDYIDENDYIKSINSNDEIIQLSGNELDLLTKDENIDEDRDYSVYIDENENNESKENIIKASSNNMRKDNFLLEEQTIENNREDNAEIIDSHINKEEEERKRTDYYINKFKKMYEDYIKSLQENNKESEIKKEGEERLNNSDIIERISEDVKEEEKTEDYIIKFKKMHEDYIKSLQENEKNKVNDEVLDNSNITDELSAEEEKMYRDYLGDDAYLIEEPEDINMEYTPLEMAKNELKKKEEALSKLEIIGELSAEEESIFDDILQQNKNKYYGGELI